ncbi:MAG: NAD(P)-binding domain-containing protein [Myxococcales bacterium]|nr:NAD(P)-binding domain-containing protein [Myxococcales bacterium]
MALTDILPISFEFSSKLGVRELPEFDRSYESNIDGLYIVGDLADAPIIKAALNQGYDVAMHVLDEARTVKADDDVLDLVIVGAGPGGIGAGLAAIERDARYLVLEREKPFATIQNFPKNKLIFSEPRELPGKSGLWFEDARKEHLTERWEEALEQHMLNIHQPEEVVNVRKEGGLFVIEAVVGKGGMMARHDPEPTQPDMAEGAKNVYRAKRVILAIGRRGAVTRLQVPGADLEKVAYALKDPDDHAGRDVLVVGGGDSAVEAAMACAEAGAQVTISYRRDTFSRAKGKNKAKIEGMIAAGDIRAELGTVPAEITERTVTLARGEERIEVDNDDVLAFLGTKLPKPFLHKIGLRMNGDMDVWRAVWIGSFALMTYLFYVIKTKRELFPFGPEHPLGFVPDALKLQAGYLGELSGSFWGTVIYSLLITGFGIAAFRKYPSRHQKMRYVSLIVFQLLFLFGIPEIIAPAFMDRPWKMYALSVPWPLSIWSLVDAPSWAGGSTANALTWLGIGAFTSFVAMPIFVYYHGERFCSWMCGCGGLAETLGDRWRHLAPRGSTAISAEWGGRIVLLLAIPTTALILNDAWGFFATDALASSKNFAQQWYGLMVDFWLASVVGVAFYPYLGNRVWCRFFCPLRAYMELLSKWFSRIQIVSNDKCIGCGECTRFCQMGIDVQRFAQRQDAFHNGNSACIQCGICVEVCPMNVLSVDGKRGIEVKAA